MKTALRSAIRNGLLGIALSAVLSTRSVDHLPMGRLSEEHPRLSSVDEAVDRAMLLDSLGPLFESSY